MDGDPFLAWDRLVALFRCVAHLAARMAACARLPALARAFRLALSRRMAYFRASVAATRKKLVADTAARNNRLVAHGVVDLDAFRALAVLCHALRAPRTLLVVLVAVVDLRPVSAFSWPLTLVQAHGEFGSAPHRSGNNRLAAVAHQVLGRGLQTRPTGPQMAGHLTVMFAARKQLAALTPLLRQFAGYRVLGIVAATLRVHHRVARRTLTFVTRPVARMAAFQLFTACLSARRHGFQTGLSWRGELIQLVLSTWTVGEQGWRPRTLVAVGCLCMTGFCASVVPAVEQVIADLVALETARPLRSCRVRPQRSTLVALERGSVFSAIASAGDGFFTRTT
ncbi:hypothetical protein KL936_001794 [Ogataea polymorpha]|nr:hypothetical protein KL936_001794 [Ogataea polymorpha]